MGWLSERSSRLFSTGASGAKFNTYQELLDYLGNIAKENDGRTVSDTQLDIYGKLFDQGLAYAALKEQRAFDDPSAQLQRLMQTGMSRDAALQMINGSGSGGSGGSPLIGASAPLVPSESQLRGAQRADTISNIVINSLNTLANLANVGAQIPIYMQTAEGMAYQNQVQQQVMSAQESINQCYGVIQQAINDDVVKGELKEFVGNRSNTEKAVEGLAKRGFQPAIDFINNGGLKSLRDNAYSAGVAEQMYYNLARPEQYMTDSFMQNRMNILNQRLSEVDIDKMLAEIEEHAARTENLIHDTWKKDSEILLNSFSLNRGQKLLPLEEKQLRANIRNTNSLTKVNLNNAFYLKSLANYTYQQADALKMQNDVTRDFLYSPQLTPEGKVTTGKIQLNRLNVLSLYENTRDLCSTYGNKEWYKHHVATMLNDAACIDTYSYMRLMYSDQINNAFKESNRFYDANKGEITDKAFSSKWLMWFYNIAPMPSGTGVSVPMNGKSNSIDTTIDFVKKYAPMLLKY